MIKTRPSVRLVAKTEIDHEEMRSYLEEIGADEYVEKELLSCELDDGSELVRFAGKMCYNSFVPGLNPNVTKVTEGGRDYVANILKQAHGSVLEHVTGSFLCTDVSRVLTHELVRHRVGIAYSQESLRYVRLTDLRFWMPSVFDQLLGGDRGAEIKTIVESAILQMESKQVEMANLAEIDGLTFADKKKLTSAFRRIAPMGLSTKILFTANVRTLRHLILMRTSLGAEEEIRIVFDAVAGICKTIWPALFQDFEPVYETKDGKGRFEIPVWTCSNGQQPYDQK